MRKVFDILEHLLHSETLMAGTPIACLLWLICELNLRVPKRYFHSTFFAC